jgi:hypothetical protein
VLEHLPSSTDKFKTQYHQKEGGGGGGGGGERDEEEKKRKAEKGKTLLYMFNNYLKNE